MLILLVIVLVMLLQLVIVLGNAATATTATNATKLGGKNASQYVTNDRFAVLTGTITMPEANSEILNGTISFPFPNGFTKDNCIITGLMSRVPDMYSRWATTGCRDSSARSIGNYNLRAIFWENNTIRVDTSKATDEQASWQVEVKVVLMKIS